MGVGGAEEWRSTVESSINVTMEIVDCGSPKTIHPGMCIIFERDDLTSQMTFSHKNAEIGCTVLPLVILTYCFYSY